MYKQCRNYENLEKVIFAGAGGYGIPVIEPVQWNGPCEFIDFNAAVRCSNQISKGVHFFIDDYRFNRLWTNPQRYVDLLHEFKYVMSPDFSTYVDFPVAIQIYNHYRKHWIGAYLQEKGICVIPTISWGDENSYNWCFDGEPSSGVVAVSSVGTQKNEVSRNLFLKGYRVMIEALKPETIIFYGSIPDECKGNIVRIKAFQEKFKEAKCNGW